MAQETEQQRAGEDGGFIHLHTHSAYSLAEGAIKVKALVKLCKKHGMPALAITDTNNVFGAMEFALDAAANGVQPIIGAQVEIEKDGRIVLLVRSEEGYRNLCHILTRAYMEMDPAEGPRAAWSDLQTHAGGLLCLTAGAEGPSARAILESRTDKARDDLLRLKGVFGDGLYIGIGRHGLREEAACEEALIDLAYAHDVPLVAVNDVYFAEKSMHAAHDALLCIAGGRYVGEEDRRRVSPEHYFKSTAAMRALFADLPEAADNTLVIARRCHFLLRPVSPLLPPFPCADGRPEPEELAAQAREGLDWRLENFVFTPEMDEAARAALRADYTKRLEYELGVIVPMGFAGYFLITSDFIKWAKDNGIPVGPGRGSGAGSLVAWSLRITDLDPIRFGLLFERFLNPERVSMPDFDIDFCQDRRDEVIHYVQRRYGVDRVAQIITFGTLQARAVVRDVGRVLQLPYGQVDRIAKMIPSNPANPVTLEEALAADPDLRAEMDREDTTRRMIDIALQLEGLYRHASTHAAGVVIGDRALENLVALYRDPRSDLPATQFNMKFVEQTGLIKFDFLGLKTMTVIQKTVDLLADHGVGIDYLQIPLADDKTFALLQQGRTVGVFQLESAGMRDTARKMKINRFEDIIALVAMYRPGPMENIPRYIELKEGKGEPDYMHPRLEPYLTETFGIMIYQEQVMQAAQVLAGYTLGGADLLRRAMGKKIKAEMDAQRAKFVAGAKEHNNVPEAQSEAIFDNIAKFAGYGFNKSHAAAYALISWWTAWLKANHPLEFMAASMTLDMGNTDKLSVFRQDLDRMGISLLPPDINRSDVTFAVDYEAGAIRYALAALKGVGAAAMENVVAERTANGPFKSLEDFAGRIDSKVLNRKMLEALACAGAFDTLDRNRAKVEGGIDILLGHGHALAHEREVGQASLFGGGAGESGGGLRMAPLPDLPVWDPLETLRREFEAVGFYLSAHPLDSRAARLKKTGATFYADVLRRVEERGGGRFKMAGVVLRLQQKVSKSGNRYAFLQLSDPSGVYEATVFSEALSRAREVLSPGSAVLLNADCEMREESLRVTVQIVEPLDAVLEGKLEELCISLDAAAPVGKIREILRTEGQGPLRLRILADAGDLGVADILLPGRWTVSAAARADLRRQPGICDVAEL